MKQLHPILAITLARLREFIRRPEAVFWVYFFPVLMVVVLGIAFRNQPIESFDVDVVSSSVSDEIVEKLSGEPQIKPRIVEAAESRQRLRTGKTTLMISSRDGSLENIDYLLDPSRPGSLTARNIVDNQLQAAAGRQDVIESRDVEFSEPGGRYVDFLGARIVGNGFDGRRFVGRRICDR